ncbi:hypothetical protein ACIA5D_46050 [Actinoplanes sp. NPDC051513]|uniref:hypothetical protein n=1 Tax=Actinoplanes sp. NPDC051513 TaxID=3363908 RepID=UPI003789C205
MSSSAHHSSHRRLITDSGPARDREPVDAIIVPSGRRAAALAEAGRLADELGCTLLVLCSKHADALEAVAYLTRYPDADVIAVDYPEAGVARLPLLETSTVLGESRLRRRTDTSAKRNLGLVLARLAGWKRVVFLDDDIVVPDAADLERAVALLDTRDGVGLHIGGFPDNSVVCHANRETGARQDTFIGGGALAVPADRIDSFFPEVYNEDWFFLVGEVMLRPVGQVGTAFQKPYDPFANPDRARGEEFGDVLAEGLFALFDDGGRIADADRGYWKAFLAARLELIEEIRARIERTIGPITLREKYILESLAAASGRLQFIEPRHCVGYIRAWRRDRERWHRFMRGVRPIRKESNGQRRPIEVALDRLRLRAFHSRHAQDVSLARRQYRGQQGDKKNQRQQGEQRVAEPRGVR